ncbi:MAG: penicillin-binding protein 2 [candidate division WOR-3 bacterium]
MVRNDLWKFRLAKIYFSGVFAVIIWLLIKYQIIDFQKYQKEANSYHLKKFILSPKRGEIYDRKKRILAYTSPVFDLEIYPQYLDEKKRVSLCSLFLRFFPKYSFEQISQRLTKRHFFYLAKNLDYETGKILEKEIHQRQLQNALYLKENFQRVYPYKEVTNLLGFLNSQKEGVFGIEKKFDQILKGKEGYWYLQKDACANLYPYPNYPKIAPVNGKNIYLTIDLDIQKLVYEELKKAIERESAKRGSCIVINCESLEILAMVDYPEINNNFFYLTPSSICESFEPGSIFKLIILATILNFYEKEIFLKERYDLRSGYLQVGKRKIYDAERKKLGIVDFFDIFIYSSNIGVSQLALRIKKEDFYKMVNKFGFGKKVDIGIPNEDIGFIPYFKEKNLPDIDFCNNAFGQGIRTNLLQIALAYLAIAQNGYYVKPILVKKIGEQVFKPETVEKIIDEKNVEIIKEILSNVCTKGTGKLAVFSEDIKVCGKTGTAQKFDKQTKSYSTTKSTISFIGFFPMEKPKILIVILLDEPQKSRFASEGVCPIFRNIAYKLWYIRNDIANFKNEIKRIN